MILDQRGMLFKLKMAFTFSTIRKVARKNVERSREKCNNFCVCGISSTTAGESTYYTPIYGNVIIAFMTIVIIIWCVYKDHYVGPFAEA